MPVIPLSNLWWLPFSRIRVSLHSLHCPPQWPFRESPHSFTTTRPIPQGIGPFKTCVLRACLLAQSLTDCVFSKLLMLALGMPFGPLIFLIHIQYLVHLIGIASPLITSVTPTFVVCQPCPAPAGGCKCHWAAHARLSPSQPLSLSLSIPLLCPVHSSCRAVQSRMTKLPNLSGEQYLPAASLSTLPLGVWLLACLF